MRKRVTIFKVFGVTDDLEEYLRGHGLWYVSRLGCWCTLCSPEDARRLLRELSLELTGRFGLNDPIVLVSDEEGRLNVTVQLE